MEIFPIRTRPIVVGDSLTKILDTFLPDIRENDILCVTSKIVSICENRIRKLKGSERKMDFVADEADRYFESKETLRYHMAITIKNHTLIPNAGIDESNGNGYMVFWPSDPFASSAVIWKYLRKSHKLRHLGIIITDSHTTPLRWGTTGISIGWCGFEHFKNYIGKPDIFGRKLKFTKANLVDGLATSGVLVMGEGNERTPMAIIRHADFVSFTDHLPTEQDKESIGIPMETDIYAPLITSVPWNTGKSKF